MWTHYAANLPERGGDIGSRGADIVHEDFGNDLKLEGILLQFFLSADPGRIELQVQVLRCEHESFEDFMESSLQVGETFPSRVDRQHLGRDAVSTQNFRLVF